MFGQRPVRGVVHADGDGLRIRRGSKCQVSGERLVVAPESDRFGQVPEVPRRDSVAFHAGLRFRQRHGRGFSQALAQRPGRAPSRITLRVVHDPNVHPQVRRRLVLGPDVRIEAFACDARGVVEDGVPHVLPARLGALEELRHMIRDRNELRTDALGESLHRPCDLVAHHPGHEPVDRRFVHLVQSREGHVDGDAV